MELTKNEEQSRNSGKDQKNDANTARVKTNQKQEVRSAAITVDHIDLLAFAWTEDDPAEENAEKQSQTDQASRNITKKNTSAHKIKHKKERKEKKTGGNDSAAAKKAKSQRTLSQDVSKKNTASQLSASTGSYDVTVSYDEQAKIPENATLRIRPVSENEDAYKNAKAAVLSEKGGDIDADSLGMAALDISIMSGGKEFEPAEPVAVSICAKNLPGEVKNIAVHHITSGTLSAFASANSLMRKAPMRNDKAVPVVKDAAVQHGKAVPMGIGQTI